MTEQFMIVYGSPFSQDNFGLDRIIYNNIGDADKEALRLLQKYRNIAVRVVKVINTYKSE